MRDVFLGFEWQVAPAYEWADVLDGKGRPITVPTEGVESLETPEAVKLAWQLFGKERTGPLLKPSDFSSVARCYRPMERAALFRDFADLDFQNLDAIREFATTYGLLGVRSVGEVGESHLVWANEIVLMNEALTLNNADLPAREAEERLIWSRYDKETRARWKAQGLSGQDPAELRKRERRERLLWLFNVHLKDVHAQMRLEADAPRLSVAPRTLLAALWLQLSLASAADKRFEKCKFCSRFFEISSEPTGKRRDREFCTDSCKTLDYRRRRRTALKLATSGAKVAFIANRTDTKPATIRNWLKASAARARGAK
jgi:hypothetical protein